MAKDKKLKITLLKMNSLIISSMNQHDLEIQEAIFRLVIDKIGRLMKPQSVFVCLYV